MNKNQIGSTSSAESITPQPESGLRKESPSIQLAPFEWPTLFVAIVCYSSMALLTYFADVLGIFATTILLSFSIALYSSLQHEVLHGHPFSKKYLNEALVFPSLGLLVPYGRFRDTHLQHHYNPALTDPYDDPESNYIDPKEWVKWFGARKALYQLNNSLLGRILIGPLLGLSTFYSTDIQKMMRGNQQIQRDYLLHILGFAPVILWWQMASTMDFWIYFVSAYLGMSILKIRTFLEHTAHERAICRTVIIEDRGPLSLIFLKNNLHAVHHAYPSIPWYRLQKFYASRREDFLQRNGGYAYSSYRSIIVQFLFKSKDTVVHPLYPRKQVNVSKKPVGNLLN